MHGRWAKYQPRYCAFGRCLSEARTVLYLLTFVVKCGALKMFRGCSRHPRPHIFMSRMAKWRAWVNPGNVLASKSCPARWLAGTRFAGWLGVKRDKAPFEGGLAARLEKIPGCHVPVRPWRCNSRGSATPANSNGRAGSHRHLTAATALTIGHKLRAVLKRAVQQCAGTCHFDFDFSSPRHAPTRIQRGLHSHAPAPAPALASRATNEARVFSDGAWLVKLFFGTASQREMGQI